MNNLFRNHFLLFILLGLMISEIMYGQDLKTNGLKITALGQVKKKGARGDRIPVVNFESKKVLYARVMDANTVKIDF